MDGGTTRTQILYATQSGASPSPAGEIVPVRGQWQRLAGPVAIASCLTASWVFPPLADVWTWLDRNTFQLLNGSLAFGTTWQTIVAYSNVRAFDLAGGALLVGLMSLYVVRAERVRKRSGWSGIATFLILVALGRLVYIDGIVNGVLRYTRPSPTLVMADCFRLSQLLPGICAKDASPWCFPSDHGYFVLCVALFLTLCAGFRLAATGWLVAIVLSLPRLISGAHWLSDFLVGSMVFAILTIAPLSQGPSAQPGTAMATTSIIRQAA